MSNTNCRFSHRKISFRHRRAVKTRVSRKLPFLYVRLLLEKTSLFPEPAHKGIFGLPRRYPFHRWPICTTAVTSDSKGIDWYEKQKKKHTHTHTHTPKMAWGTYWIRPKPPLNFFVGDIARKPPAPWTARFQQWSYVLRAAPHISFCVGIYSIQFSTYL